MFWFKSLFLLERTLHLLSSIEPCLPRSTDAAPRLWCRTRKEALRLLAAEAALAAGEPAQALTHIKAACTSWPHSVSLWNLFSRAATALGNMRQGQKVASLLHQTAPDSVPLRLISGHCHCLGVSLAPRPAAPADLCTIRFNIP